MLEELGYKKYGSSLLASRQRRKTLGHYIIITSDPRYHSNLDVIEKVKAVG